METIIIAILEAHNSKQVINLNEHGNFHLIDVWILFCFYDVK